MLEHGLGKTIIRVHAFVAIPIAIGDPGFVDIVVRARHHSLEFAAQDMTKQVATEPIVRRDERNLRHFPRASLITERLRVQRANRAQIDDVARQFMIDTLFDVGADLHIFAAAGRAKLWDTRDLLTKAHTTSAMDATGHVRRDERAEILIFDDALTLVEAGDVSTKPHREIL